MSITFFTDKRQNQSGFDLQHWKPFALSLSKGKGRPFILRQAQDERAYDLIDFC
jgi:hypothetical protein